MKRVEKIIKQDPMISLKLLKYINSAAFGLGGRIRSIKHALAMLGENVIRKWVLIMVFGGFAKEKPTLLTQAVVRAKFCEQISPLFGLNTKSEEIFMTGLFSLLDAILDQPMESILSTISIPPEIENALQGKSSPYLDILDLVKEYERADWESVSGILARHQIGDGELPSLYNEALHWEYEFVKDVPAQPVAV
jgi:EAL and modified HD-GYP domain-containing signal transduction protein